jgi:hypothetical protein
MQYFNTGSLYLWLFLLFTGLFTHQIVEASLRQIAYISTTTSPHGMDQSDIEAILIHCRKYNAENGVTGVLVYHDVNVFQIIESDSDTIDKVFVRIRNDSRHRGIIILHDKLIGERAFPKWNMMFRDLAYTARMEEWAKQSEKSLFDDITQIGNLNTPASSALASRKAVKLLEVYTRLIFHRPILW